MHSHNNARRRTGNTSQLHFTDQACRNVAATYLVEQFLNFGFHVITAVEFIVHCTWHAAAAAAAIARLLQVVGKRRVVRDFVVDLSL